MKLEYILEEKDFLDHQLYGASMSNTIKKKRQRSRILVPVIYFLISLWSLYNGNVIMTTGLIVFAVAWLFIFPIWDKQRYINHYRAFIKENYKERMNRTVTLEIGTDYITGTDGGSESRVATKEIEEITEIPSEIFIRLKTGQSFILPKDKIKDLSGLTATLKELASALNISYNIHNDWLWK